MVDAFFGKVKKLVGHAFPNTLPHLSMHENKNHITPSLYMLCHHHHCVGVNALILKGNDMKFEFSDGTEMSWTELVDLIGRTEVIETNPIPKKAQGIYYFLMYELK